MTAQIIDGKAMASRIRENIASQVVELGQSGVCPGLAVVLVGDDPASQIYVGLKEKACQQTGIRSEKHVLPVGTSQQQLLELIGELNSRPDVHGILVQLPLPEGLDETSVIEAIAPEKDVDGFHPINVGLLVTGRPRFVPCTPLGIIHMLEEIGAEIEGRRAVVIGRSNIVGKPMAHLLLQRNATVTLCHSRTRDLIAECRRADILVVAVGRSHLVKGEWIKDGATVIDVGINRTADGLVGDVEFTSAAQVAGWITPVPGGVGPMTIAMLLQNTLKAARMQIAR